MFLTFSNLIFLYDVFLYVVTIYINVINLLNIFFIFNILNFLYVSSFVFVKVAAKNFITKILILSNL